ncbi:MAG: DUF362 domain-containing protein [Planctomycetota bacterium]|nr:DUF362 domain-containing protein [Planctomycetota bacterium]
MPPLVVFVRQCDYDYPAVKSALERALAPLGGMAAFVRPGAKVVLKPNLVLGYPPERAATTHPAVVRAVAELALACGGKVSLGDSPGIGSCRSAAEKAGLGPIFSDLGIPCLEFTPSETRDDRRLFRCLTLARELLEADVVINLPKLKTHCQMLMTMAVKNLFGAVVGLQKFQWHYRAGADKALFGRMLYEICAAVNPSLNILDAIVAMDGNGPTHGEPNATGFIAASPDPCALDAATMRALGLAPEALYTLQAAAAAGNTAWQEVALAGEPLAALKPARWQLPMTQSLAMEGPNLLRHLPFVGRWLMQQVAAVPFANDRCRRCRACVDICPAQAIALTAEGIKVDSQACIRCYCCHELCASDGMTLQIGWLGRILGLGRK